MRAVQIRTFGEPGIVLELADLPEPPAPAAGQVLIGVEHAPINMNDLGARVIADTLKESGLDWQGFYACRRGFGTMLVLAGATLDEVADAMGNSPDVVFKHYFKDKDSKLAAKGMAKLAAAMAADEPSPNERLLISGGK